MAADNLTTISVENAIDVDLPLMGSVGSGPIFLHLPLPVILAQQPSTTTKCYSTLLQMARKVICKASLMWSQLIEHIGGIAIL